MKKLYSFYWDCGRSGDLSGLFIAEESEVQKILGKEVYFGEVLGKHSEIYDTIGIDDIKEVSSDTEKVEWLENLLGSTVSGYNPLDYFEPDEDEEDELD